MVKNIRRASQALFALLFLWLFLQTEAKGANELGYPVKIFLDADPLLASPDEIRRMTPLETWIGGYRYYKKGG